MTGAFAEAMTIGAYRTRRYSGMVPLMTDASAVAMSRQTRWSQRLAIGLLFAFALANLWIQRGSWGFEDVGAYWEAAFRLRDGLPLYGGPGDPDSYRVFRYAPWFAYLWVPLSYLPRQAAELIWAAGLGAASLAVLWALVRLRTAATLALALVLLPWFLSLVQVGNVQPLVVAMLAFGISRRSGPLWIALAASIKAVPILYLLVYVARREWARIGIALAATALLVFPVLLTGAAGYTTDPGRSFSLYYYVSPLAWAVAGGAATVLAAWLAWRRSPFVWVATSVAVMLVAPRAHPTYATFLVVGLLSGARDRIGRRTMGGTSGANAPPG
jgi:hypothetical protein